MNTSSSTSTDGTPTAGAGLRPSRPGSPRTRFAEESRSAYARDGIGISSTSDSTEERPGESTDTSTPPECSFEFIMSGSELHPVGIVCTTHGWVGDVGGGL